jgi:glucokinase
LRRVVQFIKAAESRASESGLSLVAVGIGVCAPLDHRKGEIVESAVLPGWKDVPVRSVVGEAIRLPVQLENDATLAILGEWWLGAGEQAPVVAGATLGTGIGGGLIVDGCAYRGGTGFGAEFGHIKVAEGPPCPCGGSGCVGRVASATATLERFRELAGTGTSQADDIRELAALLQNGHPAAKEAVAVSVDYLARAAVVLINCLNPNVFVVTGGLAFLGEDLIKPIREHVRCCGFHAVASQTKIVTGDLGVFSGCFGAAYLAFTGDRILPREMCIVTPVGDKTKMDGPE